jgi:hypothetical protein
MTFRETLEKHLRAIQERDLKALADTVFLKRGGRRLMVQDQNTPVT